MVLPVLKAKGQGLQFNSNDSLMGKRTSYEVFKQAPPTFNGHLSISFSLSLWDNAHLGYVLNITDSKANSYSLSYIYFNKQPYLNFNIDSRSNKITIPLSLKQLSRRTWIPVKVDLDLGADKVTAWVGNKRYDAAGFGFENSIEPKITFGKNARYSDVPNMAIKNLEISDASKTYSFPLNEWEGKIVRNDSGDDIGFVDNPVWLINDSYFWKPRVLKRFNEVAGLNFNQKDQNIFMFKSDSLTLYDVKRDVVTSKPFRNMLPLPMLLGKSVINPKQNKCYVYEVYNEANRPTSLVALDLAGLNWEVKGNAGLKEQRHHHNIFYDNGYNDLYLFGGYGLFKYHNDFFKYDTLKNSWQKASFTGARIDPRFFSAYSQANEHNEVYIFGGIGNQSGDQVVGGMHFYDLYRVNLTTHTIKKCWEIKPKEEAFVPANNMVLSKDGKFFYVLCYPHERPKTSLRLYRYSIKDGSYEKVSGKIPVTSERIETDVNLFFNNAANEFYCTTQEFISPAQSVVKVYSLAFPPVSEQEYLKSQRAKNTPPGLYKYLIGLALLALISGAVLAYVKKKTKKPTPQPDQDDEDLAINGKKDNDKRANAVYLLGEFTVYDKNSRDITYLFSPKIKQLFILILLNSKDKNGVVSKRISTTLWPDKDITKTKNIKGVTINHLRNIISDIEGIELTFLNDTYSFIITDDFFCDYFTVKDSIKEFNHTDRPAGQALLNHFDLIARGGMLQFIPEIWLDDFKQEYEEALMPVILPVIKKTYEEGDFRKALEVSRVVLNIDPFNDLAVKYKLKALRRTKGIEYAHRIYDEFAAEYKKSLGVEYPIHFEKICSNKTE